MSEADRIKDLKWKEAIVSVLEGAASKDADGGDNATSRKSLKVKKLRKLVLLSLQLDDDDTDKAARKIFKKTIQGLEEEGGVALDSEGTVTLLTTSNKSTKKKRKRKDEDSDKPKKEKKKKGDKGVVASMKESKGSNITEESTANGDEADDGDNDDADGNAHDKNAPCRGNPQGVTRLFLGNLPFAVDETSLEAFIPGMTHVKWITDKETGKFYGSAFVEMKDSTAAATAVAKAGSQLLGRPVKVNFAPALPGDSWPPEKRVVTGGATSSAGANANGASSTPKAAAGGVGIKAMSAKPDNCVKLFMGNLSYDIDDDGITKFFASVDAEVKAVRWIHHKDTGDFKGVGFVEFWNTEACDRAAALNGKNLLGRPIRIDWTD